MCVSLNDFRVSRKLSECLPGFYKSCSVFDTGVLLFLLSGNVSIQASLWSLT